MSANWIVITSIDPPNDCIRKMARLHERGWSVLVVGDSNSPPDWQCTDVEFLSLARQREEFGALAEALPTRHYSRKNLGYLHAVRRGARLILETDDDHIPYPSFGQSLNRRVQARALNGPGWVNVYKHFSTGNIWPRGLPLDAIHVAGTVDGEEATFDCPVQQYLVDGDPDVDAIHRLVFKEPVDFDANASPVALQPGTWVPFNSQNTLFFEHAFCLTYLPCYATFRMTDIWRSFVVQMVLAAHGKHVSFHPATARQIRNAHDLMKDFEAENVGYLHNRQVMETIREAIANQANPRSGFADTARIAWTALVRNGYLPEMELAILDRWFAVFGRK